MNSEEVRGAIARAYCNPLNSGKELDAGLVEAAVAEVMALVAAEPKADDARDASLPAEATDEMQDNMRQALIDQGWSSDSAGEVDFADLWRAAVYEFTERKADMLAAQSASAGEKP